VPPKPADEEKQFWNVMIEERAMKPVDENEGWEHGE
jgi:hypothetical protein